MTQPVGHVRLERPSPALAEIVISNRVRRNAVSMQMWDEFDQAVRAVHADESVRGLLVRGDGADFCSGGDITEYDTLAADLEIAQTYMHLYVELMRTIRCLPIPTVAALDGVAVGAGLGLATACDFRLATEDLRISITAVKRGLVFPIEELGRLASLLGMPTTRRIVLMGQEIRAKELLSAGFMEAIVPREMLRRDALTLVERLAASPRAVFAATKRNLGLIEAGAAQETDQTLQMAAEAFSGDAFREGTRDFLRRRTSRSES